MKELLVKASRVVGDAKGQLGEKEARENRMQYRKILEEAENECPVPDESLRKKGQRGRTKRLNCDSKNSLSL